MSDWLPIASAPKDGRLIKLGWKEPYHTEMQEWFTMRWGHIHQNGLFPGKVGMWVAPDGSFTWNDTDVGGPTHWMPYEKQETRDDA